MMLELSFRGTHCYCVCGFKKGVQLHSLMLLYFKHLLLFVCVCIDSFVHSKQDASRLEKGLHRWFMMPRKLEFAVDAANAQPSWDSLVAWILQGAAQMQGWRVRELAVQFLLACAAVAALVCSFDTSSAVCLKDCMVLRLGLLALCNQDAHHDAP